MKSRDFYNFLIVRPLPDYIKRDIMGIPIMHKTNLTEEEIKDVKFTTLNNLSKIKDKNRTILTTFQWDETLNRYWNDPLKYITPFKGYLRVGTPDFSAYTNMDEIEIAHNVYKNRWLGCLWQELGIKCIPTIAWAKENTDKYCFAGVEKGSDVVISTLSNYKGKDNFLRGYNKMLEIIEPKTIFVKGNLIEGMTGNIVNFKFKDTFAPMAKGGD